MARPDEFNELILGKPPREYCDWITKPSSWGGAIEMAILSEHYGTELAAFNVQTAKPLVFGTSYMRDAMIDTPTCIG